MSRPDVVAGSVHRLPWAWLLAVPAGAAHAQRTIPVPVPTWEIAVLIAVAVHKAFPRLLGR